jgi:hypothetical protein
VNGRRKRNPIHDKGEKMITRKIRSNHIRLAAALLPLLFAVHAGQAQAQGKNGTTLAAYKTLDICIAQVDPVKWRYSGDIAVWNEGAVATQGLTIIDTIQHKVGTEWVLGLNVPITVTAEIPAGTTSLTPTIFHYSVDDYPLSGTVRNVANVTITNHSGSTVPKGPETKFTFTDTVKDCPQSAGGCAYTQGYWGSKPGVAWPYPYSRGATFYLSGQTWQQVLDTAVNGAPGYYQLAHQFIAATLNVANGALLPAGIKATLADADAWLNNNTPAKCTAAGSCGLQRDWAAVLDEYNNGQYAGGPPHCE